MTTKEQRELIHVLSEEGKSCQFISETVKIGLSTVKKWRTHLKKGVQLKVKWDVQNVVP